MKVYIFKNGKILNDKELIVLKKEIDERGMIIKCVVQDDEATLDDMKNYKIISDFYTIYFDFKLLGSFRIIFILKTIERYFSRRFTKMIQKI
jgi:hypothetical protein